MKQPLLQNMSALYWRPLRGGRSADCFTRCCIRWLPLVWRNSGLTPRSFQITELFSLSWGKRQATLQRNLISASSHPWSFSYGQCPKLLPTDERMNKVRFFSACVRVCIYRRSWTQALYYCRVSESFFFLYHFQLEWFLQRLTQSSTSIVTTPWSNRACNWNNRLQFHKHKCA